MVVHIITYFELKFKRKLQIVKSFEHPLDNGAGRWYSEYNKFKVEPKGVRTLIYDYSKLLGRIVEIVGTQSRFAELLGRSERTVSLKLNNKISWTQEEMLKTSKILKFDKSEIPVYFFAQIVQV